ncbi:Hypothetical protein SCF082_LOCUS31401 [Durusdinium trenchii]|uniref:Glycosyltransferase 2-like domain-containing protein n=1 Tax=Durusdinium trenchii TaxID=1381693 RepID=A0ABP0N5U9_9DINO
MSVMTRETRASAERRRPCSIELTVVLVLEVVIIIASVIILATMGSGDGITFRTDIGALICGLIILLGMLMLALLEIVTNGTKAKEVLLVYLQITIHFNAAALGALTLLGHATWLLAQLLLILAAFAWVVGCCGGAVSLWHWLYYQKVVPKPRMGHLLTLLRALHWKTAFFCWAVLVTLTVVALVFPKLPETVGLSQELSLAEHVLLMGTGGLCYSALFSPLFLALSRRARCTMRRVAGRRKGICLQILIILGLSVVLHFAAGLVIPLAAHILIFILGLMLTWLLVSLTRCARRRAIRPPSSTSSSGVLTALFMPMLGLLKVMAFMALFLFDCAFVERFTSGIGNQDFTLVQRDGSCGQQGIPGLAAPPSGRRRVVCTALANSGDDIARAPSWKDTLKGAAFWANPNHWDKVPQSLKMKLIFIFFKVVGTIGGYRGRAAFARKSGLKPLMKRREEALAVVDLASEVNYEKFPNVQEKLREAPGSHAAAVVLPVYTRTQQDVKELRATLTALSKQTRVPDVVLLVDDASPEELEAATREWPDDRLALVRLHRNVGPAGARSVGLRLLRQWAVMSWLASLTVTLHRTESGSSRWLRHKEKGVGRSRMGRASSRDPRSRWIKAVDAQGDGATGKFHDHFGNLNGRWSWDDPKDVLLYGCTCNFSVNLNSIDMEEFDPIFSRPGFEDIEFCWRLRVEKNVMTRYCEKARMYHQYDHGPVGLYRQFWKYGHTEPIMAWMHPDFTFQGSRPVTVGFNDPRDPEAMG